MPAHSSERVNSDSESDASKVETQKRKHSFYTHFTKDRKRDICLTTKITRVPCRRRDKGSIPRAEKFADLTTADHKEVNPRTITGTLSWYKMSPLNGYNLICEKTRIRRRWRRVYESFLSRHRSQKLFIQTIHENLANPVKNYHGIIERLHLYRSETNGIAERTVRRVKEGTSAVLLQSGLDDKWWSDSVECYCCLRNVQELVAEGKNHYERRFGEPVKGQQFFFGAMVENHPISTRDPSTLHQFGKKVLPGIILGYEWIA